MNNGAQVKRAIVAIEHRDQLAYMRPALGRDDAILS